MEPVNLLEYEPLAREKLSESAYGFIAGAAEDEVSLRENRAAFQRLRLRPPGLVDVSKIDPAPPVLGQRIDFPVLLAPVAVQRLAHPDGELASARAAAAAGTIMALSTSASCSIEEVARAAEGPRWFQLYFNRDRELTRRLVERAEAHGYSALCLTVDPPSLGRRDAGRPPRPVRPLALLEGRRLAALPVEDAPGDQGHPDGGRRRPGRGARGGSDHRLQPRRPPARWGARQHRGAAGGRRSRRRPRGGASGRGGPPR